MRTINAASYIHSKLAAQIATYPAGSVSKREIIAHVTYADETVFAKLNELLTRLVYSEAAKAKLWVPVKFSDEAIRLTGLAQSMISSSMSKDDA